MNEMAYHKLITRWRQLEEAESTNQPMYESIPVHQFK